MYRVFEVVGRRREWYREFRWYGMRAGSQRSALHLKAVESLALPTIRQRREVKQELVNEIRRTAVDNVHVQMCVS